MEETLTGQIIAHLYNPYTQEVTTWISPVFDIKANSVDQYHEILLDQIKILVTKIYQERYSHIEKYRTPRFFGDLINFICSNGQGKENSKLSFFISTDNFSCEVINLQDLFPKPLCLDEILDIYDKWAAQTRDTLISRYNKGQIPVGTTFEIQSEDFVYHTKYPIPPSEEAQYLNPDSTYGDKYIGFIL